MQAPCPTGVIQQGPRRKREEKKKKNCVCGAVLPALIKPIERLNIPQATPLKEEEKEEEEVVLVALPAPG